MSDKEWLLREASKIAKALGETFAPYCEVILSDLTNPEHVITQIENSMSGREVGDAASLVGLARIMDPSFPDVMANFADAFRDGRPVKSTSIGLRDKSGKYVAALYLNIDISYIKSITAYLNELIKINEPPQPLYGAVARQKGTDVYSRIATFAASRNREPRALTTDEKRELLRELEHEGELERRGAAEKIASIIGVTRTQIYYYLRNDAAEASPPTSSAEPALPRAAKVSRAAKTPKIPPAANAAGVQKVAKPAKAQPIAKVAAASAGPARAPRSKRA